jgi:hypothetical protein
MPPPVLPAKKRGIPLVAKIILVLCAAFVGLLGFRVVQFAQHLRAHPREQAPGEAAFREANRQVISGHGKTGFGNTPEAVALAEAFSKDLKALRAELFTAGKGDKDLFSRLTKGEFPVYCHLTSNACVLLVHVPELRRFTDEAKESLGDIAWGTAQKAVRTGLGTPPPQLVVGVKGELWYDPILIGQFVAEPQNLGDGIQSRDSGLSKMNLFYPFFASDEEPPATGGD